MLTLVFVLIPLVLSSVYTLLCIPHLLERTDYAAFIPHTPAHFTSLGHTLKSLHTSPSQSDLWPTASLSLQPYISTANTAIADFTGAVSSFYTLSSNIHESSYFTARDHTRSAGGLYQSVCLSSTHISIDQSLFGLDKMSALSHTNSGSECTQVANGITYDHHPGKDYCTQLMLYLELLPAGIIRVSSPPAVPQYLGHNSVWTPHLIFSTLYATDHLTVSWCLIFGHSSD